MSFGMAAAPQLASPGSSLQEALIRSYSGASASFPDEEAAGSCCRESRLHPGPDRLPVAERAPLTDLGGKGLVRTAVGELPAVCVAVLMTMVNAVTYGSLVFSAPAFLGVGALPDGVVVWLLATAASQVGVLTMSRLRGGLGAPALEDVPIIHAIFANIARALPGASPEELLGTCLALTFSSTLLLGLLLWLAGRLGASRVLRAVPLVVLKGALFGVSIFLLRSSVEIATSGVESERLQATWHHWATAMALGSFYFALDERLHSPQAMAACLLLVASLPSLAAACGLSSLDELRAGGWLFGPQASGAAQQLWYARLWEVYSASLPRASWGVVARQIPAMVGLWFSHALLTLMDLKAIELLTGTDISLDDELKTVGVSNVVSSLSGACWPTYILCSMNVTAYKLGARTRFVGFMTMLGTIGGLFVAQELVPHLPRVLPASVAWWLGIVFMKETILNIAMQHTHTLDIFIVAAMAVTILLAGFLEGLLLGFLLAMGSFTLMYSSHQVAVTALSDARYFRSNAGRSHAEHALLERLGHRIAVVHADGYLMFGSSPQLIDALLPLLASGGPSWIVLNFRGVRGLDYSAVVDLAALGRRAQAAGTCLVITELRGNLPNVLARASVRVPTLEAGASGDIDLLPRPGLCHVRHYQAALRLCEDALLNRTGRPLDEECPFEVDPVAWLINRFFGDFFDEGQAASKLRGYFDETTYPPGATVWAAGDPPTFMAGVLSGELLVFQDLHEGGQPWLQEVAGPGTFLGFGALSSHTPHSTTATVPDADASPRAGPCKLLCLQHGAFLRLCEEDPRLGNAVLRGLLRRISYEWRDLSRLAAHA